MKMYDKFLTLFKVNRLLFWALALCGSCFITAEEYTPLQISEQAQLWLTDQLPKEDAIQFQVVVYPLDKRIAAKVCESELNFSLVTEKLMQQNSIKVWCQDEFGWQLYVSAKVQRLMQVLVSERQLAPGNILTEESVKLTLKDQWFSRGPIIQDRLTVIGAKTKRNLNIGQIITQDDLCLVCKGDIVTIEGISDKLVVATSGEALNDGAIGESIAVKNLKSGRTIQASVAAVKKVVINL